MVESRKNEDVLHSVDDIENSRNIDISEKCKIVGEILQVKRLEKQLTIKDIATEFRLKEQYVQFIEEGNFSDIEGKIYIYGYIKIIADKLDIDSDKLLSFIGYYDAFCNKSDNQIDISDDSFITNSSKKPKEGGAINIKTVLISLMIIYIVVNIFRSAFSKNSSAIRNDNAEVLIAK